MYGAKRQKTPAQEAARERRRQRKETKLEKERERKLVNKKVKDEVWKDLPLSLTLEIYKKLPIGEFYQLREVCKDLNQLARERRFITDPIHKPYFVLTHEGDESEHDHYLHGILTYRIVSSRWEWKPLHRIPFNNKLQYKPFSANGLTFSRDAHDNLGVFDEHTKKSYTIPEAPRITTKTNVIGMTVDTTLLPYTFKVILGSFDAGTQVYDSLTNAWKTRSSLVIPCKKPKFKNSVPCEEHLYIWSELDKILVYSLKEDKWSTLKPPPRQRGDLHWPRTCIGSLESLL